MAHLMLALLLSGSARPAARVGLDGYMAALAEAVGRWHRVYQLTLQERTDEAEALVAAPLPAALEADFASDPRASSRALLPVPRRDAVHPLKSVYALAEYGLTLGVPDLAVPVFDEAVARGEKVPEWAARAVWNDLEAVGAEALASEWAARYATAPAREGQTSPDETLALRGRRASLRARARWALAVWNIPPSPSSSRRKQLELLASVLPPEGRRLAREALLEDPQLPSDVRAAVLTRLAKDAPRAQQYAAWERLSRADVKNEAKAQALVEMAGVRLREGRPCDAVVLLTRARDSDPRVAPEAQWRLAVAWFRVGDYAAALEAFRRSEIDLPRHVCCGESHSMEHAFWEGLTLEHLGRTSEAVPHYMFALADPTVMAHLLDLYEAAGQFQDLEQAIAASTPEDPTGYGRLVSSLELLVMRRMARAGDWASVMAVLREASKGSSSIYGADSVRLEEAVRLLSRSCDETGTVLAEALGPKDDRARPWIAHALGRCATPTAVERLRSLGLPDAPDVPYRPYRPPAAVDPSLFPPATPTTLPARPVAADHRPRPYRGPEVEPCYCD